MDIEEDSQIPIIVGRPFWYTAGTIIDVKNGRLTLKMGIKRIKFTMTSILKDPYTKVSFT